VRERCHYGRLSNQVRERVPLWEAQQPGEGTCVTIGCSETRGGKLCHVWEAGPVTPDVPVGGAARMHPVLLLLVTLPW